MIKSFADKRTEMLFNRIPVRAFSAFERPALKRLMLLHRAENLQDLQAIRGNRLEALKDERAGQFSIRINDRWRICFRWMEGDAYDAEIVDYH
ncbi:MAG: type II toxin-antitoxin system RelE/ParE family toxin [Bryobacteraceae bacterium]